MTTITDTTAATAAAATTTTSKAAGAMDQNDFLKLMTTQLTTQDPFNPVDNTQMVAQMAQFSQVAGISEMNASLKALTQSMGNGRLSDAASWIGKNVLVEAANAAPLADGSYAGEIALPQNADEVNVSLVDATGQVVHTQSFGAQKPGTIPFAWDGKGADGQPVPGPLKIAVVAKGGGSSIETAVAAWTRVTGIQSPAAGGTTQFMTGLGTVPADAAIRLS